MEENQEEHPFRVAFRLLEKAWRKEKEKNDKAIYALRDLHGVMEGTENMAIVQEAIDKMEEMHEAERKEFLRAIIALQKF